MSVAASRESPARPGSGVWRVLGRVGLVAAVLGSALFLALVAMIVLAPVVGGENPPGWSWLERTTGMNDDGAAAVVVGLPLVLCLIGLVIGIVGWVRAHHGRAPTKVPRLTVLLTLAGPIAVVILYAVGFMVFLSSGWGPT